MERSISVDRLVIDETLHPRQHGIDRERVASLMETPQRWPAVMVARLDGTEYLVDGFHRVAAARALGMAKIEAVVLTALVEADLATMAYGANAHHGLPLTLVDRVAYVSRLIGEDVYDDTALASIGYLAPDTVRMIRRMADLQAGGTGA